MTRIVRGFVDGCEFKEGQYRGLQTESMVEQYFLAQEQQAAEEDGDPSQPRRRRQHSMSDLNLLVYIVIRDEKLLQLRDKIEAASLQSGGGGVPKGRVVQFLFKICQQRGFDFNWCLDLIRDLESEVYLPLNKIAKELGLKEPHQYMLQIFTSEEGLVTAAESLEPQAAATG